MLSLTNYSGDSEYIFAHITNRIYENNQADQICICHDFNARIGKLWKLLKALIPCLPIGWSLPVFYRFSKRLKNVYSEWSCDT